MGIKMFFLPSVRKSDLFSVHKLIIKHFSVADSQHSLQQLKKCSTSTDVGLHEERLTSFDGDFHPPSILYVGIIIRDTVETISNIKVPSPMVSLLQIRRFKEIA